MDLQSQRCRVTRKDHKYHVEGVLEDFSSFPLSGRAGTCFVLRCQCGRIEVPARNEAYPNIGAFGAAYGR